LVLDRINPLKKFVKKYSPIHANHERTPIVELPKLVLAIKTLLGASTVVANTFSIDPLANLDYLELFMDTMGKNNGYIGEVQKKFLEPKEYYVTEDGERIEAAALAQHSVTNDKTTKTDSKQAKNTKSSTNPREESGSGKQLVVIPDMDKLEKRTEERMLIQKNNYIVFGVPFVKFG